jgi:hypothetical protein
MLILSILNRNMLVVIIAMDDDLTVVDQVTVWNERACRIIVNLRRLFLKL